MDRGVWRAESMGLQKSDMTERLTLFTFNVKLKLIIPTGGSRTGDL